jgi:hypothetical protein
VYIGCITMLNHPVRVINLSTRPMHVSAGVLCRPLLVNHFCDLIAVFLFFIISISLTQYLLLLRLLQVQFVCYDCSIQFVCFRTDARLYSIVSAAAVDGSLAMAASASYHMIFYPRGLITIPPRPKLFLASYSYSLKSP